MFKLPRDIQAFLEKNPVYYDYLKSNRGACRYLRCEFPPLMGYNTLTRPQWLPRSIKYPYFDKPYGIQAKSQERLMRPHVNRFTLYGSGDDPHSPLKKAEIQLDDKALDISSWGEIRVGRWKKNNNIQVLVKIFDKSKPDWEIEDQLIQLETCKRQSVAHVNFVHYYGSLENKLLKYHIFEYMSRGTLLDIIKSDRDSGMRLMNDDNIRKMWCQIVFAVSYLHDKDLVHRNLKLENVLVADHWDIRITDLAFLEKTTAQNRGDAHTISRTKYTSEFGPKMYKSPERMKLIGFNPLLDQVWALGVMLYAMLHRKFPFSFVEGNKENIDQVLERGTIYPRQKYPNGLLHLLSAIFEPEERRPRTFELFEFEWVANEPAVPSMKQANEIGKFTHEKAKSILSEKDRMLKIRKKVFKRFRFFRADMLKQPTFQRQGRHKAEGMLEKERVAGHKLKDDDLTHMEDYDTLNNNDYWPSLFEFKPIKCKHFGGGRNQCAQNLPNEMVGNLLKLQDKVKPQSTTTPSPTSDNVITTEPSASANLEVDDGGGDKADALE